MNTQRRRTTGEPTALIFTLLALVALIGLLMGILTHTLVRRQGAIPQIILAQTATATTKPVITPTEIATTQPTAPATTPTANVSGHFQLTVTVSPKIVKAGQPVTITVYAYEPNSHAAIAGLSCLLRKPIDGSPSFLSAWPSAQVTDASGAARWTLTAPTKTAGIYEIEAYAKTSEWSWKADTTINLKAS